RVLFKPNGGPSKLNQPNYAAQIQTAYAEKFTNKPAPPEVTFAEPTYPVLFAQLLTPEKLSLLENVAICPVIFQDYVEKRSELRVTIVGERIFAAEIHSQDRPETQIDFRELGLLSRDQIPRHTPFELPLEVRDKLLKLMERLGIVFGCVDLIRTP